MGHIDVRPALRADVRELSVVLGHAFYDDPVMTWMVPDAAARAKALRRAFVTMPRHHFLAGESREDPMLAPVGIAAAHF